MRHGKIVSHCYDRHIGHARRGLVVLYHGPPERLLTGGAATEDKGKAYGNSR
jgi:hypothetical protein